MAGTGRARRWLRWPAGAAGLVIVLAAAGSVPVPTEPADDDQALFAHCRTAAQDLALKYRNVGNTSFVMSCARPDGTIVDPRLWAPAAPSLPPPTRPITAGRAGCVTGPARPVVGTTLLSVSATARPGEQVRYEYQPLDGGETIGASGSRALEFEPGDLAPGGRYRWRARVDDAGQHDAGPAVLSSPYDDEQGWSPWCEFAVSPSAVDYRGLGDVSLAALQELGLRPDRRYAISLTRRQQRLLRAGTNVGRTSPRMTLTGPRWTDLLVQLSDSALVAEEAAIDGGEEDLSRRRARPTARWWTPSPSSWAARAIPSWIRPIAEMDTRWWPLAHLGQRQLVAADHGDGALLFSLAGCTAYGHVTTVSEP